MNDQTTRVADLVLALGRGRVDLQQVLAALAARGQLPRQEIDEGMQTVWRLQEEQVLDEISVTTLLERLQAASLASDPAPLGGADGGDDATVVAIPRPAAPAPTPPADAGEDDQATRMAAPPPRAPALATSTASSTGTGTGTSSTSEWSAVAQVATTRSVGAGDLLKGRFHLERELGRGGMGVVWLARDERKIEARDRDPYVAVKVLSDEFRRHPDSLVALQREARRSQQLAHDNIVRVYDFDKDGAIVFMTMEYVDGSDLKTLIREQAWNGMPLARAWPLIEGMGRALARAHAAGIVHSDFKPGNVMVTADGVPKVFDFGIARAGKHAADADGEQTVFDAATLGALTPAYASLEMIRGEQPGPRDDIYALGCVCYELLTGKHPFGKVSAEVALREGRKPPLVPGLSKRQQRTLARAVAFEAKDRLPDVQALLDGLRAVPLRERALPLAAAGGGALLVIGGGLWAGANWFHHRQLAAVVAGFDDADPRHYRDEAAAQAALDGLSTSDRRDVLADHAQAIVQFLLKRLDALWNPPKGLFDYQRALGVFALRDRLRLYSPELDARRAQMDQQRDAELNRLDTDLERQVAAGALYPGQQDNVLSTLDTVRLIDPSSPLLHSPQLEMGYDAAIAQSLQAGDLTTAQQRLTVARGVFPDSLRLQLRQSQVVEAREQASAAASVAAAPLQDAAAADRTLQGLLAAPAFTVQWQDQVHAALDALKAGGQPATPVQLQAVAKAVAGLVAGRTAPAELARAQGLVAFGLAQVPGDAGLQQQQARLQAAQQALDQQLAGERTTAEVAARTESLRRAAAAGDLDKARQAYARIATLQPDSAFLKGDGADLLARASTTRADAQAAKGDYPGAAQTLAGAVQQLPGRAPLAAAQARYALVADVLAATGAPEARRQALGERLQAAYRDDAAGMRALEAAMKARGQLPEGSLQGWLDAHGGALEPSGQITPAAAEPAKAGGAGKKPRNSEPAGAGKAGATTAPAKTVAEDDEPLPPVPDGPDPCGLANLPGTGRACYDTLDGGERGPMLAVVPGAGGGKAYALSRGEVTIDDFNAYCRATSKCSVRALADPALGRVPVTGISLGQAKAYARWLIRASGGWRYRLPTDAEWLYAAQAGRDWKQAPDSNCVPPTATSGTNGAPVSIRGRQPNPWGLVNMSGNVWEWTVDGAAVKVRGGSYSSYWSDCSAQSVRQDSGGAQPDVGFRVLRELK